MVSPLMAFKNVDLPAPLEPITVTNSPSLIFKLKPRKAGFSIGVPGLNVSRRFCARIMMFFSCENSV